MEGTAPTIIHPNFRIQCNTGKTSHGSLQYTEGYYFIWTADIFFKLLLLEKCYMKKINSAHRTLNLHVLQKHHPSYKISSQRRKLATWIAIYLN
jgi:hypothetical protein